MAKEAKATGTSISERATSAMNLSLGAGNFKVKRQVVFPLLKHKAGEVRCITITSAMYEGKEIVQKEQTAAERKMGTAMLVKAIDLEPSPTRNVEYIVNAVLQGVLNDEYPNDSYVGKSFAINKLQPVEGKRYNTFEILEIEPE